MFFTQFGLLFSNMQWYVIVCMVTGLAFLLVEVFQPGFGFFGIGGFVLLALSIILRAVFHSPGDNVLTQVFQMLLLYFVILGVAFVFLLIAHKKNWLKRASIVQNETAVNETFSDGTEDFSCLLGKTGRVVTDLHPSGKADIEGRIYDVVAENFFVCAGEDIVVKTVEGVKIGVEQIK